MDNEVVTHFDAEDIARTHSGHGNGRRWSDAAKSEAVTLAIFAGSARGTQDLLKEYWPEGADVPSYRMIAAWVKSPNVQPDEGLLKELEFQRARFRHARLDTLFSKLADRLEKELDDPTLTFKDLQHGSTALGILLDRLNPKEKTIVNVDQSDRRKVVIPFAVNGPDGTPILPEGLILADS